MRDNCDYVLPGITACAELEPDEAAATYPQLWRHIMICTYCQEAYEESRAAYLASLRPRRYYRRVACA